MTVCIAVRCRFNDVEWIIGATDQMLTAGDVAFEPPRTKTFRLGARIVALMAGDAVALTSVCQAIARRVLEGQVGLVEDVANIAGEEFRRYRRTQAEQVFLSPLGLTLAGFAQQQQKLAPEVTARLVRQLTDRELGAEIIIAGVDERGGHLYHISDPGLVECHDDVGFVAIGAGSRHAESQLMLSRYTAWVPFADALLVTYISKKRAEIAPGVGTVTDVFGIGPQSYVPMNMNVITQLDNAYHHVREREELGWTEATDMNKNFIQGLLAAPPAPDAAGHNTPPPPAPAL